jgi:hypothetical protein
LIPGVAILNFLNKTPRIVDIRRVVDSTHHWYREWEHIVFLLSRLVLNLAFAPSWDSIGDLLKLKYALGTLECEFKLQQVSHIYPRRYKCQMDYTVHYSTLRTHPNMPSDTNRGGNSASGASFMIIS